MKKTNNRIILGVLLLIAFLAMGFLFYMQSDPEPGCYKSDFKVHIQSALGNGGSGYSLEGLLVILLDRVCDGSTIGISLLLSLFVVLTVLAVGALLGEIDRDDPLSRLGRERGNWIGLWSVFAAPLVIPHFWFWFYKNAMNINAWHNSTYMEMRLFSVLSLVFFVRIQRSYLSEKGRTGAADYLAFSVTLLFSTWFKPSFFVGFAPMMAIWLLLDLISNRKRKGCFRQVVLFGLTVIPSCCILALQYWKLYGSRENTQVVISTADTMNNVYMIRLGLFLAIPLLILLYNRRKVISDYKNGNRLFVQVWVIWAFELLYHLIFAESGRSGGNFGWGVRIGNYLVAVLCVRLFWCNVLQYMEKKKSGLAIMFHEKLYLLAIAGALLWELACGLLYFVWLLTGRHYMI